MCPEPTKEERCNFCASIIGKKCWIRWTDTCIILGAAPQLRLPLSYTPEILSALQLPAAWKFPGDFADAKYADALIEVIMYGGSTMYRRHIPEEELPKWMQ